MDAADAGDGKLRSVRFILLHLLDYGGPCSSNFVPTCSRWPEPGQKLHVELYDVRSEVCADGQYSMQFAAENGCRSSSYCAF